MGEIDTLQLVRDYLSDTMGIDKERVVPEATLTSLGVDSLMLLEMMFDLEDRFHIEIQQGSTPPNTVAETIALIDRLRQQPKGATAS